jgi:hypothetical protein
LPEPDGPTMAVEVPALILKLTPYKVSGYVSGDVGYLNLTFSKTIPSSKLIFSEDLEVLSLSAMRGTLSMTSKTLYPTTQALATPWIFGITESNCIIAKIIDYVTATISETV